MFFWEIFRLHSSNEKKAIFNKCHSNLAKGKWYENRAGHWSSTSQTAFSLNYLIKFFDTIRFLILAKNSKQIFRIIKNFRQIIHIEQLFYSKIG